MTKTALRKYYLEKRSRLDWTDLNERSKSIADWVINGIDDFQLLFVHFFISIPGEKELNTQPIFDFGKDHQMRMATSITRFKPKRLEHSIIDANTSFSAGIYNVPVPSPIVSFDIHDLDLVLVPLLCVDHYGNRIGYGQGFYDGFLGQLPEQTKKIGLSLFPPVDHEIKRDDWDVTLDAVITPQEIIKF